METRTDREDPGTRSCVSGWTIVLPRPVGMENTLQGTSCTPVLLKIKWIQNIITDSRVRLEPGTVTRRIEDGKITYFLVSNNTCFYTHLSVVSPSGKIMSCSPGHHSGAGDTELPRQQEGSFYWYMIVITIAIIVIIIMIIIISAAAVHSVFVQQDYFKIFRLWLLYHCLLFVYLFFSLFSFLTFSFIPYLMSAFH